MDPLRLLSRSTRIRPDISLKRKRDHSTPQETHDTALDFFDRRRNNDREQKTARNADSPKRNGAILNKASDAAIVPDLDETACKQILRSHKLKITRVLDHNADVQKRAKKADQQVDDIKGSNRKKHKVDIIPQPLTSFSQLHSRYNLSPSIVANLAEQGYTDPTEVQVGSLPLLMKKELIYRKGTKKDNDVQLDAQTFYAEPDLLSVAPTGSGKTLAFLIPALNSILEHRKAENSSPSKLESGPQAIVIAPTKELARQITNEARKLAARTGIKVALLRKGMTVGFQPVQNDSLGSDTDDDEGKAILTASTSSVKAHILITTPLTMVNAICKYENSSPLNSVRTLIFDEADVLLDPLFREQTLGVWLACTNPLLRVSLWSATMGSSIEDLAISKIEERWRNLPKHDRHRFSRSPLIRVVVGLKDSAVSHIHHKLVYAGTEQGKLMGLRQLLHPSAGKEEQDRTLRPPFLVFTQTIARAVALHSELLYDLPQALDGVTRIAVLHSDLSETARDKVMTSFRKGEIWVLITTDLLSRGVDFKGINGVVNYDFPNSSAAYVHRVGRTGRAGRVGGVAITLYAKEDIPFLKNVANVIAASERQKGTGKEDAEMQKWLLDSLPKPSKKEKQMLKKKGIESRRTGITKNGDSKNSKSRISTRSGFERRLEYKKKGAIKGNKTRQESSRDAVTVDDDRFEGFSE